MGRFVKLARSLWELPLSQGSGGVIRADWSNIASSFARKWISHCEKNHAPASWHSGAQSPILLQVLDGGPAGYEVHLAEANGAGGGL
jgi:hypothetical protein